MCKPIASGRGACIPSSGKGNTASQGKEASRNPPDQIPPSWVGGFGREDFGRICGYFLFYVLFLLCFGWRGREQDATAVNEKEIPM